MKIIDWCFNKCITENSLLACGWWVQTKNCGDGEVGMQIINLTSLPRRLEGCVSLYFNNQFLFSHNEKFENLSAPLFCLFYFFISPSDLYCLVSIHLAQSLNANWELFSSISKNLCKQTIWADLRFIFLLAPMLMFMCNESLLNIIIYLDDFSCLKVKTRKNY